MCWVTWVVTTGAIAGYARRYGSSCCATAATSLTDAMIPAPQHHSATGDGTMRTSLDPDAAFRVQMALRGLPLDGTGGVRAKQ